MPSPVSRSLLRVVLFALATACAGEWLSAAESQAPGKVDRLRAYVGTYTRGASKGIYLLELDLAAGKLQSVGLAGEAVNPSFVALHPSRPLLYTVGEIDQFAGKKSGAVSAFSVDPKTGRLTLLSQESSQGTGPCHLAVDRTGQCVVVANYGSGSVACLPILEDGRLGPATSFFQHEGKSVNPQRQQGPHAHCTVLDAANRFLFVCDLGLEKIMSYRLDPAKGELRPSDPPATAVTPGSGPRHLAFHPNGRYAYVINEMGNTVTAFTYDAQRGTLASLKTISTLPEGFNKGSNTTAEVQVHPSGRFLYGSNRGHNSIAIFAIDAASGRLRSLGHQSTQGKTPRSFAIDPAGAYLLAANQDSDNIVLLAIDGQTGVLRPTGQSVSVGAPVCIEFLPACKP